MRLNTCGHLPRSRSDLRRVCGWYQPHPGPRRRVGTAARSSRTGLLGTWRRAVVVQRAQTSADGSVVVAAGRDHVALAACRQLAPRATALMVPATRVDPDL